LLEITRLGEGVDEHRRLAAPARARVIECLDRYAERARLHGAERLLAIATSAGRDAAGRQGFLAEIAGTGFRARLLSGEEEAATTFEGVTSERAGQSEGVLVIDVGGGSTETVLGGPGGVGWSRSFDAGCVRMTERYLGEERVDERAVATCLHNLR